MVLFTRILLDKYGSNKNNDVKKLNFKVGEKLSGYKICDENSEQLDISQLPGKNKLIIFAWDKCRDCKAEYENYKLLFQSYDSEELNISFVWDDTIPYEEMESLMIQKENSYSAKGKIKFTDWVPSYFLLNDENEILLKETELNQVIDYIGSNYKANQESIKNFIGENTILFGMERCSGCKKAFEEMSQSNEVNNFKYVINGESTVDWSDHSEVILDTYSILATSLKIDLFPQVVVISDNGEIEIMEYDND